MNHYRVQQVGTRWGSQMQARAFAHRGVRSEVLERPLHDSVEVAVFPGSRFSVSEVLQFLAFARKTGTVKIWLLDEEINLDLQNGHVVDLWSDNAPPHLRIGEVLVRHRALGRAQLDRYLALHAGSSKRLGRGLLSIGLINRKAIGRALCEQLKYMLVRAMSAETVTTEFMPHENPYGSMDLCLDLSAVLLAATTLADAQ
ncbi:MAG: hypothetical protein CL910_16500 [Deltaproteobacteria bacterium]|nr:hypothetical protein [Deltaproteobacteria bacterium]